MSSVAEKLAELTRKLTPTFVNGTWRKPELSGLHLAKFLKKPENNEVAQAYKELKLAEPKKFAQRPPKGHRRIRERPAKQAKIAELLKKSDSVTQKYREELRETRAKLKASDPFKLKPKS
jgi:hypothetical protein